MILYDILNKIIDLSTCSPMTYQLIHAIFLLLCKPWDYIKKKKIIKIKSRSLMNIHVILCSTFWFMYVQWFCYFWLLVMSLFISSKVRCVYVCTCVHFLLNLANLFAINILELCNTCDQYSKRSGIYSKILFFREMISMVM